MSRIPNLRLATLAAAAWLALTPVLAEAQKALVYCPVGIDAAGCNTIVAALTANAALFPDGVDAAYDGTSGTVDLAGGDLSGYAVFVVPSLADGPDVQPYSLLRNGTIAGRIQAAFVGRVAVWSGTPDVGSTNRTVKDGLIRNLAAWAKADAAGSHGPGVVALQDNSDDEAGRYGWLGAISALSVGGDPTFDVYSNVEVRTSTGQGILTTGGLQIAYPNMASFGLVTGPGGRNDATGARTSRVVLVTAAGESGESSIATVSTDWEDYSPGETVVVTGGGWEPGETVSLLFHEDVDPQIHPDQTLTAVADGNGQILNQEYVIDEEDVGIQFILTATGLTSGRTAQTTFTDGNKLQFNTAPFSVAFNVCSPLITVQMIQGSNPDNGAPTPVTLSSTAGGTFYSNAACTTAITSVTIPTSGSTASFFYKNTTTGSPVITAAAGVGCSGTNCTVTQTETITGPDLTITKTHVGNFAVGVPASYTITVTNSGTAATSGTVTVTDVQPAGLTFTGATGTGWTCGGSTTITCTRSNALASGASYPTIALNATPTAAGTVTNVATVSGGGEANTGNDSASDPTTVLAAVDLTINKSHTGNFTLGLNGSYTLMVTNGGGIATSGTVTVTDVLPAGLGFVSANGTGWTCGNAAGTVTCTRTTVINAGGTGPDITLTVSVAEAAFPTVTNSASVSGGNEPAANNGNNSDSDAATVLAPDLTVSKTHTGNFSQGANGTYSITVTNAGGAATTAALTVTDVLPAGLGFVSAAGGGTWSCSGTSTVTCTRASALGAGNTTPTITLTVSVAAAAVPSVTNTASVTGGGEPAANNGNNSDDDPTTVGTGVDLTIDKSHTGNFTQGVNGAYTLTVSNPGSLATSANVTVTDVLPAGLGFVSGGGTGGWNTCTVAAQTVTCVRPAANTIAAGGAAPAITLTVSVAAAAVPSVTNTASVAGGGEPAANNGNNSDSDPTTVSAGVDLTIDKSHTGNFTEGVNGTYSLAVSNAGGAATNANVTVTDVLPAGLGFVSGTGTGWNACTAAAQTVTCVRPAANTIAAAGSAPAITLTVTVAAAAVPSVTNTASVAGGGEPAANNGNNSDSDPTTVIAGNVAPLVNAGGPYTGDEGSAIPLNTATATDADAGDTPTYKWTYVANGAVDAGTTCSFSNDAIVQPTFTCNDDGAFTVTLTVNDGHGHIVADDAGVTVANVKPTATAGGPYTGSENAGIQLGGTGDDPAANDDDPKLTYKWTVNAAGIDAGGACTFDDDTEKNAKVTCTDDGAFTVTLVATDDDGAASTGSTANLTVSNANPVADAGGPYSGDEGTAINLVGSATDAGPNDAITYKWTADVTGIDAGGSCAFGDDTQASTTVTCTDNGAFKVKLTATDDDGGSHFEEVALAVANVEPVADAGGPYNGNEGAAISLNGTVTDAGSNDTHTWSWQYVAGPGVDAGATCQFDDATAMDPKITCTDDGQVKLTLTVQDDNGGTGVDEATLTLANVKPVANAGGSYPGGAEGSATQLNGSATDAGTNDVITYKWTANVSGLDAGGTCSFDDDTKKDAEITCTDNGTATLTLKATDDDGGFTTDNATLTVANVDPVANAGGPYTGNEGAAVNLSGSATDAGANDTHTWSWQYVAGAGVDAGATCSFSDPTAINPTVTCTDDGEVQLTLTVTDDDGGSGVDQATLTLDNVAPTANAHGPYSGDEGAGITLAGTATDPAANDVISYKWTANVSGLDAGASCSFDDDTNKNAQITCTDDGPVTLTLKATDDDGEFTTSNATLTVLNVDPVPHAGGPYTGNEGAAVNLSGSVTDAGANDTHLWSWQYLAGPGVDAGATCSFSDPTAMSPSVTCTDDGEVKLTLKVTDDDGGEGTAEATLTLSNVAPVAHTNGPYPGGIEGSATQLNGTATDAGSNDTFTYLWTVTTAGIDAGGACTFDNANLKNAKVTCTDDGAITLTLKVTDDDNDFGTEQTTLTVANANPVAVSGGPYTGNEGAAVTLNGSATDPGSNDPLTYLWTANAAGIDGGGSCSFDDATNKAAKVTCTDNGSATLTLTASDDDGGSNSVNTTLTLQNVKPTIAMPTAPDGSALATTIIVAGTLNIKVPFSDPATNDTHKAQIDCGSGYVNVNGGADVTTGFLTSCTFATVGTKTIKIKVTDDDAGYDEKTHTLTVKYNFIGFSAPVDRPTTQNISKAGQAIPLKWQLLDANGVPVTNLTAVDIKISSLSCGGNVPTDLIEEYASGASGLNNKGGGNYQFNWKTPTNYTGTCKNIGLDFGGGYVEVALAVFNFKS